MPKGGAHLLLKYHVSDLKLLKFNKANVFCHFVKSESF